MTTASKAFLGSGKVYLDRLTAAGASTGLLDPAELGVLEIAETTELKKMTSKGHDTYGQVAASVSVKQPATLKISLKEVDAQIMALALLGTVSVFTQIAGTVAAAAEDVTLIPGRWVQLAKRNITPHADPASPIVIATDVAVPVSVPLADVEINHRLGLIKYIGTTLTEPTACTIGYAYGLVSGSQIAGSTQPQVKFKILFDGMNMVTGEYVQVEIDEATCSPSSPIDFMSEDFAELILEGEMRTVAGQSAPYRVTVVGA
jgi:hypothetical protein